jgi:uracil-DNA glycosylase
MPIIEHCEGCPYRDGRAIGTRGEPGSRIVLVGEAPGAKEVIEGRPFVGPAGDVLWGVAEAAGLREADLFVANSVACRPFNPDRRNKREPTREAIDACHERLVGDLAANIGAVIVALGRTAIYAVTGVREFPVTKSPDSILSSPWGPVVPTVHPAWVLRFKPKRSRLVDDLIRARLLAEGAGQLPGRV